MSSITLNNKYIGPVSWENKVLCDHDLDNYIDVWQVDINEHLPHIDKLRDVLTPGEITRANKYLRSTNRDKFIISRGSLRHILSGYLKCPPFDISFKLTESNKPEIDCQPASKLHFNLSDSADKVLIAIAASPVGIDVELINPKFSYHAILHNNFSLHEAAYINLDENFKRFFLLWTRKEAILKATGIGLTDNLKLIPALDGQYGIEGALLSTANNWQLNSFEINGDYIATIATNVLKNNLRFWDFFLE
jgi:4'-phosphopantetheinyl transferase